MSLIHPRDVDLSSFPPAGSPVVVAMSGGVDSSVVAAVLYERGYDVMGITLQLYDAPEGEAATKGRTCCASRDIFDAKRVAHRLGFAHYVLDYSSRFHRGVVDYFVTTYLQGHTPVPCVMCNRTVKFVDLLAHTQRLGGQVLATGHYVRRRVSASLQARSEMHKGDDARRDQSYFLFGTTPLQLDMLRFPLASLTKDQTRDLARFFNLPLADKPDSQDICFIPDGDHYNFVKKQRPDAVKSGPIRHVTGQLLGTHKGICAYTVGQRRGLGVSWHEPLFVVYLCPETHTVVLGCHEDLACNSVQVSEMNWLAEEEEICALQTQLMGENSMAVKFRSSQETVSLHTMQRHCSEGQDLWQITFASPAFGVSLGQALVLYDGSRLLGGGWIVQAPSVGQRIWRTLGMHTVAESRSEKVVQSSL